MQQRINRRLLPSTSSYKGVEYSQFEPVYGFMLNDDGQQIFCEISQRDLRTELNAEAEMCDLSTILSKINPPQDSFKQLSEYMEQYQTLDLRDPLIMAEVMQQLRFDFDTLPKELREKYGNDYQEFTRAFMRGDISRDVDSYIESVEKNRKKINPASGKIPEVDTNGRELGDFESFEKRIAELESRIQETSKQGESQK